MRTPTFTIPFVGVAVLTLIFATLFSACSSSPKLYPNDKYKSAGKEVAEQDIKTCETEADDYLSGSKGKQVAKRAAGGAGVGAAVGGVLGLFSGNLGGGLVEGAAVGGAAGASSEALSPNELKHRYVNRCLSAKGYEVLGWD